MPNKMRSKGLIERELENPEYRKRHEERYEAFKLEVQILNALEQKRWTYSDLARATHTSKSNVSRDLKAGGILSATFSRLTRIAEALGMKFFALLIPKEHEYTIIPKIEELFRSCANASTSEFELVHQPALETMLQGASLTAETKSNLIFVQDVANQKWQSSKPAESVRFEKFYISSSVGA